MRKLQRAPAEEEGWTVIRIFVLTASCRSNIVCVCLCVCQPQPSNSRYLLEILIVLQIIISFTSFLETLVQQSTFSLVLFYILTILIFSPMSQIAQALEKLQVIRPLKRSNSLNNYSHSISLPLFFRPSLVYRRVSPLVVF